MREHEDLVFISQNGMVQRTGVRGINRYGRASQGVKVMNLREGDEVSAVALVVETEAPRPSTPRRSRMATASTLAPVDGDGVVAIEPRRPRTALRRDPAPRTTRTSRTPWRAVVLRREFRYLTRPEKGGGPKLSDSYYGTLEVSGR